MFNKPLLIIILFNFKYLSYLLHSYFTCYNLSNEKFIPSLKFESVATFHIMFIISKQCVNHKGIC